MRKALGNGKRKQLYQEQGGRCFYCDEPITLEQSTFDHKIPQSRGGKDGKYNLVIACFPCNKERGTMNHLVFLFRKQKALLAKGDGEK